jgi:hypothetical protein
VPFSGCDAEVRRERELMTNIDPQHADALGARASNAGDQFHELWALQQALELLNPASGLSAVTVEGVATDHREQHKFRSVVSEIKPRSVGLTTSGTAVA